MNPDRLAGKTILVIGGNPKEAIDGVRYYTNQARPEDHGHRAAAALEKVGAHVLLLTPETHKADASAADMLQAAQGILQRRPVDAIVQLANFSSLKAAQISRTKLKVKKEAGSDIAMEVVGNSDVAAHLCAALPHGTVVGYDHYQQFFTQGDAALGKKLRTVIESTLQAVPERKPVANLKIPKPNGKLSGTKIIVTNGPTIELLTPDGDVITNFSSGEQGFAIAVALADMGADVTLICGPTRLSAPVHPRITTLHTQSAYNMLDAVLQHLPADAYVGVAAIADFGMPSPAPLRLKENEPHTLRLSQNPDILHTVGHHEKRPAVVIGFAAETHDLMHYASGKLAKKGADAICANPVDKASRKRIGNGNNHITWMTHAGAETWPVMTKAEVGPRIGDKIAALLQPQ